MTRLFIFLALFTTASYASEFGYDRDGIPVACTLIAQAGTTDEDYCSRSVSKTRCYANVQYRNGRQQRFWGDACVVWESDCEPKGKSAIRPACLNVEDL